VYNHHTNSYIIDYGRGIDETVAKFSEERMLNEPAIRSFVGGHSFPQPENRTFLEKAQCVAAQLGLQLQHTIWTSSVVLLTAFHMELLEFSHPKVD
jgi:hypothetical protein